MGQGRNRKALLAIAALSGALGACEGEHVLVGSSRDSLNLDVCMATSCEAELPTETLEMPAPRICEAELGPELEPDFSFELSAPLCPADADDCSGFIATNLVVSPDGTSWVLGAASSDPQDAALLLARISAEGELLDRIDASPGIAPPPENSVSQERSMVMDARGHVFVLVYEIDGGPNADSPLVERAWLTEYDADGSLVDEPRLITGLGAPKLAMAGDETLIIAANAQQNIRHGVLAAMTTAGQLLWSQNGVRTRGQGIGYGVTGVATAAGSAFVAADRAVTGEDGVTYGITRFDGDGNAIWDRALDRPLWHARLYAASDEHVLLGAVAFRGPSWLGRLSEDGEVDWTYDVAAGRPAQLSEHGVVVHADRGTALVVLAGVMNRPELLEISLDGERCARHPMSTPYNAISHVALDADGAVYVMDNYRLARVRLPTE